MVDQYRPCVGIMLINEDNKVFVGRRLDFTQAWQMPQGGIDAGETPLEAAYRELDEETGISKEHVDLIAEHPEWLSYDLPDVLAKKLWDGSFKGQTQKWFAFRFLGHDSDVNLEKHIPEFSTYKWTELTKLTDEIVPFKRQIYENLIATFSRLVYNNKISS